APLFLVCFAACGTGPRSEGPGEGEGAPKPGPVVLVVLPAPADLLHVDLVQRTCALYVAVRSSAWEGPMAFGRDVDDDMVHWNLCPSGNQVACASVSDPMGDPPIAGLAWPYGDASDK